MNIIAESGPTVGILLSAMYFLFRKLDAVDEKFDKLDGKIQIVEQRVSDKLNNGIKDELTLIKTEIASIQGELKSMPKRRTDETT